MFSLPLNKPLTEPFADCTVEVAVEYLVEDTAEQAVDCTVKRSAGHTFAFPGERRGFSRFAGVRWSAATVRDTRGLPRGAPGPETQASPVARSCVGELAGLRVPSRRKGGGGDATRRPHGALREVGRLELENFGSSERVRGHGCPLRLWGKAIRFWTGNQDVGQRYIVFPLNGLLDMEATVMLHYVYVALYMARGPGSMKL